MPRTIKRDTTRRMAYKIAEWLHCASGAVNVGYMATLFELSTKTIERYIKDYEDVFDVRINRIKE